MNKVFHPSLKVLELIFLSKVIQGYLRIISIHFIIQRSTWNPQLWRTAKSWNRRSKVWPKYINILYSLWMSMSNSWLLLCYMWRYILYWPSKGSNFKCNGGQSFVCHCIFYTWNFDANLWCKYIYTFKNFHPI